MPLNTYNAATNLFASLPGPVSPPGYLTDADLNAAKADSDARAAAALSAVAAVTVTVASAQTAAQVTAAITTALSTLPDGTTITFTGGKLAVVGSASIPALPSAMTTTDLFDVQRGANTFTATVAQVIAGLGGGAGSGGAATPITSTYTTSGAIAITDRLALVNGASAVSMTLAAGATDGQPLIVKRYGAGAVTLTLTLDGAASTPMTLNSATVPRESLSLLWSTPLATWLLV